MNKKPQYLKFNNLFPHFTLRKCDSPQGRGGSAWHSRRPISSTHDYELLSNLTTKIPYGRGKEEGSIPTPGNNSDEDDDTDGEKQAKVLPEGA